MGGNREDFEGLQIAVKYRKRGSESLPLFQIHLVGGGGRANAI